jgi:hypothetical protein
MGFEGFGADDYDAFVPKKWGSNAFTLERRATKAKLLDLGRSVLRVHPDIGLEAMDLETTDDAPSIANGRKVQFVAAYFVRPEAVRSTIHDHLQTDLASAASLFQIALHQQHAHLFLRIDHEAFSVGARIPAKARADRVNVAEKFRLDWAHEEFRELLGALPEDTDFGFDGRTAPARALTREAAADLAEGIENASASLVLQQRIPREDPVLSSPELEERLDELVPKFWRAFRFLAWAPDNDHSRLATAIEEQVQKEKKHKPRGLSPGTRVTILGGLFAGRGGYLAELDGKGKAKVMVGPVSVTVDVTELKPVA